MRLAKKKNPKKTNKKLWGGQKLGFYSVFRLLLLAHIHCVRALARPPSLGGSLPLCPQLQLLEDAAGGCLYRAQGWARLPKCWACAAAPPTVPGGGQVHWGALCTQDPLAAVTEVQTEERGDILVPPG